MKPFSDTESIFDFSKWLCLRINQKFDTILSNPSNEIRIMQRDWDNLIILDGCRYDIFEDNHEFPGSLTKVQSGASHSLDYMERNFIGDEHHDTVYVSANPFASRIPPQTFHNILNVFDTGWNETLKTVPPDMVVDAAITAYNQYSNKRLIIHFMQPHYPFIGETGQHINSGGVTGHAVDQAQTDRHYPSIWDRLRDGNIDIDLQTVREAYIENFMVVQKYVMKLLEKIDGKSIITSDHGNLLGKRLFPIPIRMYGHPPGLRTPELVEVPWHKIPVESRRQIISEPPRQQQTVDETTVENRLRNLGYK